MTTVKKSVYVRVYLLAMIILLLAARFAIKTAQAEQGLSLATANILDLTKESLSDVAGIKARIRAQPDSKTVILGDMPLEMADRKELMNAFPAIEFEWSFVMYDISVSTADENIDLGNVKITKLEEFMDYLDCLPRLKQVDMYKSRLKEKQILALAQRYPQIHFGWTLVVCRFEVRTDDKVFSMHRRGEPLYKSEDFRLLRFCPDIVALDLGHNRITDLTFLTNFPKLKILILADNKITDLTPLTQLKDLEYLELFMNNITDVTPLSGLDKLLDLNLCFNKITDPTPLLSLSRLERLWISRNNLAQEQKDVLLASLPGCNIDFTAKMSTWNGWRTHARFYVMRDVLNTGKYRDWDEAIPKP